MNLLAALVDDAGLFPPEQLPMGPALARHAADEEAGSPGRSMLTQRFLCPAGRLGELRAAPELHRWSGQGPDPSDGPPADPDQPDRPPADDGGPGVTGEPARGRTGRSGWASSSTPASTGWRRPGPRWPARSG